MYYNGHKPYNCKFDANLNEAMSFWRVQDLSYVSKFSFCSVNLNRMLHMTSSVHVHKKYWTRILLSEEYSWVTGYNSTRNYLSLKKIIGQKHDKLLFLQWRGSELNSIPTHFVFIFYFLWTWTDDVICSILFKFTEQKENLLTYDRSWTRQKDIASFKFASNLQLYGLWPL